MAYANACLQPRLSTVGSLISLHCASTSTSLQEADALIILGKVVIGRWQQPESLGNNHDEAEYMEHA